MNRRSFFKKGMTALGGGLLAAGCTDTDNKHITLSLADDSHATGHLVRDISRLPAPATFTSHEIAIVGGGIAGLSAGRWLMQKGYKDIALLELSSSVGGNAQYGANSISKHPWAAHYLPIPDPTNKDLINFLQEAGCITGFDAAGLPIYNEYHLCHDPEERLYINGYWQEGLVPDFGVPQQEKQEIARFFKHIEEMKQAKGSDGKYAFAIPLSTSSADELYRQLDKISFKEYLQKEGYKSPSLLWYLEYACKDDYGCTLSKTSAWAGIHYFAARRGRGSNAGSSQQLTWPEGNGYLMEQLKKNGTPNIQTGQLIYDIALKDGAVLLSCYDVQTKKTKGICAKRLIMATPQYVNSHLLHRLQPGRPAMAAGNTYHPWVVANISLKEMPGNKGMPLCWDNVVYGSQSVGYVNANHQDLNNRSEKILTWYCPLPQGDASTTRKQLLDTDLPALKKMVLDELEYAHTGISKYITAVVFKKLGHGMIAPSPGYIWGAARQQLQQPIDNRIFFAHSDLSGISIFEEAFYQGINAAQKLVAST